MTPKTEIPAINIILCVDGSDSERDLTPNFNSLGNPFSNF